jgi:hypothetical protein
VAAIQNLPKTESSENTVPVLPILRSVLENYRQYLEGPGEDDSLGKTLNPTTWMFAGEKRSTSMNLPNLVRRTIIPNLTRCAVCHFPKNHHKGARQRPRLQTGRIDSEVEGLALLPPLPRVEFVESRCEAEGNTGHFATQ